MSVRSRSSSPTARPSRRPGSKCTATVGGAKLKGTGAGGCTFTLPTKAKGKKLVVTVSGHYGGATLSKTVSYTVK